MRYFGSKVTANEKIHDILRAYVGRGLICDPFGGIGSVGTYLRAKGYDVWSGDILTFAHYFQISRIKYPNEATFKKLFDSLGVNRIEGVNRYLNSLMPVDGWFVLEYCDKRKFFTKSNAMKIEACWQAINSWTREDLLNGDEKAMLLAGLIGCMDNVANTAGTYYAFLKEWHRKALNVFEYKLSTPSTTGGLGKCFNESAELLSSRAQYDVLYLDPPYNERSYARYYHLPETIAQCHCPLVKGMSGIPDLELKTSDYNKQRFAAKSLESLLANANFKYLMFHYTDLGLISPSVLTGMFSALGEVKTFVFNSKGYTTKSGTAKTAHKIYLVRHA